MQFHSFTTSVVPNILIAVPSKKEKLPLSVTHPELAKEADGWDASIYTKGSKGSKDWICHLGHKWKTSINSRTSNSSGCPFCSGNRVLAGFNDLPTKHPEIAAQAYGWDPSEFTVSSSVKKDWVCTFGHIYQASIAHKVRSSNGCPYCNAKKVLVGFNDLVTTHPHIAKEAYGWDPRTVTAGSSTRKLKWICSLNHIWEATPNSRTNKFAATEASCPICQNKQTLAGFNDLATTHPELAIQLIAPAANSVTVSSHKIGKWRCNDNHEWSTRIANRRGGARGCPSCAYSGFDPNLPAFLYFLQQPYWLMLQVGITNNSDRRLAEHKKNGWELIEIRGPMDGHLTQQWETAILQALKAKGADLSNEKIAGKFDGYSEAWSKSTFEVRSIKELMRLTEEFEESKLGD
jgi:hypothetical protein